MVRIDQSLIPVLIMREACGSQSIKHYNSGVFALPTELLKDKPHITLYDNIKLILISIDILMDTGYFYDSS